MDRVRKHPVIACWFLFMICTAARIFEYFFIRTDKSFLAENFIHKLFGIFLLFVILSISKMKWNDIGFVNDHAIGNCGKGILLGCVCFAIAYGIECLILENIPYRKAVFLIAFLFGIWHWVMPFRDYLEGNASFPNLLIMGIGYVILAGVMSMKWSMLYRLTGSLWMGLGDHLFNNVIVTNLVHVISNSEADNMQIVRILIGQLFSFAIVLFFYMKNKRKNGSDTLR